MWNYDNTDAEGDSDDIINNEKKTKNGETQPVTSLFMDQGEI